jgi:predicted metal-dependent HD superfamily phosphohydrolase
LTKEVFCSIIAAYSSTATGKELWVEVVKHYSDKKRHYHNLQHLENMLAELGVVKLQIDDWETTIMALIYHDIIYHPTAKDNEEKSAELGKERLRQLRFPPEKILKCEEMILATKNHSVSIDNDTNLFTDADLSILGKPWPVYEQYFKNVRNEYSIFPDFLYNPGRKKVLQHFLVMPRIFKTESFYGTYEQSAKSNIKKELELL